MLIVRTSKAMPRGTWSRFVRTFRCLVSVTEFVILGKRTRKMNLTDAIYFDSKRFGLFSVG